MTIESVHLVGLLSLGFVAVVFFLIGTLIGVLLGRIKFAAALEEKEKLLAIRSETVEVCEDTIKNLREALVFYHNAFPAPARAVVDKDPN